MTHIAALPIPASFLYRLLTVVCICLVLTMPSRAQERNAPPVHYPPPDPGLITPKLTAVEPAVLLSRPTLPTLAVAPTPFSPDVWRPSPGSIHRISVKFFYREMEWVTPREKVQKLMSKSCSEVEFVTDKGKADAEYETTFNDETSVWTTVVKQSHREIQRFHTFAYPKRAPIYLADQLCLRSGYQIKSGKELEIRLPHGKWEGKVSHQVRGDRAEEFEGSVTIDEHWVTIRGAEDGMIETRLIPITSVRGLRSVGEKKGLPPVSSGSWEWLLQNSGDCGEGGGICFAGGAAALGAYTVVQPLLNMFVPTHHTIELLFIEDMEPRTVSIQLKSGSYQKFVNAISRGSKAAYSVVCPVILGNQD